MKTVDTLRGLAAAAAAAGVVAVLHTIAMALTGWQQLQQSLENVTFGNALVAVLFGGLLLFWAWRARQPQYIVAEESKPAVVEPPRNFTLTQLKVSLSIS